jgi:hypothetical protein
MKLRIIRPSQYIQYVQDDTYEQWCDDIKENPEKYLKDAKAEWNEVFVK